MYFVPHVLWWETDRLCVACLRSNAGKTAFARVTLSRGEQKKPFFPSQAHTSTRQELGSCEGSTEDELVDDDDRIDDDQGYCGRLAH
jgi:hypothetical protein